MIGRLDGRTAVVTGGGGGIGRAVALGLASEGASVVINDPGKDQFGASLADNAADLVVQRGGKAVADRDSVATLPGAERIVATAIQRFGGLHILVNCAGNYRRLPIVDMTEEDWDIQIDVHLKGHFGCIKAAVPHMIRAGAGHIVNVSSRGAFLGATGGAAYAAAKAGIMGMTSALARELKDHKITVNAILPSADTALFPGTNPRGAGFPNAISLDPHYLVPLVTYLCSDVSAEVTGQFIYVSGGDLCFYEHPLAPRVFLRKPGMWTLDELIDAVPPLVTPPVFTPF